MDELEPGAIDIAAIDKDDVSNVCLASIAISLKRIANSLDNDPAGPFNIYDMVERLANK